MKIEVPSVRAAVREELVRRVLEGDIAPGARINETALATEFGVSQTPIREALFSLQREGFLESRHGRGFSVKQLSEEEVKESLPILAHLEGLALRTMGLPPASVLTRLETINQQIARGSGLDALKADREWHEVLLQSCANQRLLQITGSLKRALSRYDYAYMLEEENQTQSVQSHEEILEALRDKDLERAVTLLEENWLACLPPMIDWLRSR